MNPFSELTEIELKAAAYDCISRMEQAQSTLRQVNQELDRRRAAGGATPAEGEEDELLTEELPENPDLPLE